MNWVPPTFTHEAVHRLAATFCPPGFTLDYYYGGRRDRHLIWTDVAEDATPHYIELQSPHGDPSYVQITFQGRMPVCALCESPRHLHPSCRTEPSRPSALQDHRPPRTTQSTQEVQGLCEAPVQHSETLHLELYEPTDAPLDFNALVSDTDTAPSPNSATTIAPSDIENTDTSEYEPDSDYATDNTPRQRAQDSISDTQLSPNPVNTRPDKNRYYTPPSPDQWTTPVKRRHRKLPTVKP